MMSRGARPASAHAAQTVPRRGRPIDVAAVGTDHAERIREPGAGLAVAGIGGGLHAVVDEIGGMPEVSCDDLEGRQIEDAVRTLELHPGSEREAWRSSKDDPRLVELSAPQAVAVRGRPAAIARGGDRCWLGESQSPDPSGPGVAARAGGGGCGRAGGEHLQHLVASRVAMASA